MYLHSDEEFYSWAISSMLDQSVLKNGQEIPNLRPGQWESHNIGEHYLHLREKARILP